MNEQAPDRSLGELGEMCVIQAIRKQAPSETNGDDAAVLTPYSYASRTVCTTDMLVENRHFRLDWSTPEEVGRRAVIQNFADVEAMGARPVALLLGVSASPDTHISVIEGIATGIRKEADRWAASLVGGDVVGGNNLVLSVTAIGELAGPDNALTLDAAHPGQTLIASGPIGFSAAGFSLLEHFGSPDKVPDRPELRVLVDNFLVPQLERARGMVARSTGATAMTDNSDGLIHDLTTVAMQSNVSIDLDPQAIAPGKELLAAAEILDHDPMQWICEGGEDHTLLATTAAPVPSGFRAIGRVHRATRNVPVTIGGSNPPYVGGWVSM